MDEIIARIIELRTVRDTAHAEICELEKRLELLAEFADTPAAPALRDVFAERDRRRETGKSREGKERETETDDGTADAGTDGTRDSGSRP